MKVSLKTAKYYIGESLDLSDIDEVVTKIGAQLGAVEEVIDYGARYEGVVVAKVAKCQKHPNADKLSVCEIEVGTDEPVQVVCGAPNVREGLTVAWIKPGATVPVTYDKEPFVLESREIRGVVSNGMLASPSELGISDNHEGILEITSDDVGQENMSPGTPFKNLYGLDDIIIDVENKMFTHRPDCFGVLGVAREIAGIYGQKFVSPEWYLQPTQLNVQDILPLEVRNEIPELVPRFMVIAMSDIAINSSPIWMQALLMRIGVKPINNVVDVTNYLSYVTAQPLHAYDYDKVKNLSEDKSVLVVRKPREGEKISLLNGKTIEPRTEAIMIATDKELLGIGGVMGGTSTEVDENTKNIIIECANFDMYSIRRTSMAHGLFTDAVTRFNKGQSPLQTPSVIAQAVKMIEELAHAKTASELIDNKSELDGVFAVTTTTDFINKRLGLKLSDQEIANLLLNVEFDVAEDLNVVPPFWRTDIHLQEDIVEEVGRLYGYDNVPNKLPSKIVSPSIIEEKILQKKIIRQKLASMGANEILTYSFVHGDLIKKASQNPELAFKINNAISPDLQYYRLSLTPNLLTNIHTNIKDNYDNFALFEIGSVHSKSEIGDDGVPKEFGRVALVVAGKNDKTSGFYRARAFVDSLGYSNIKFNLPDEKLLEEHKMFAQMFAPYDLKRSAYITYEDGSPIGVLGEFKQSVLKAFKLPGHTAGFEVFISSLKYLSTTYTPLSKFPSIKQDVCLEVLKDLKYQDLESKAEESIADVLPEDCVATKQLIDIFADEKLAGKKRITFRITLNSKVRTLEESMVNKILDEFVENLAKKLDVVRI